MYSDLEAADRMISCLALPWTKFAAAQLMGRLVMNQEMEAKEIEELVDLE